MLAVDPEEFFGLRLSSCCKEEIEVFPDFRFGGLEVDHTLQSGPGSHRSVQVHLVLEDQFVDVGKLAGQLRGSRSNSRVTASFDYVGPKMEKLDAERLLGSMAPVNLARG